MVNNRSVNLYFPQVIGPLEIGHVIKGLIETEFDIGKDLKFLIVTATLPSTVSVARISRLQSTSIADSGRMKRK